MLSSTGIAIISSVYPSGERGKALGMIGITSYVGMSAGPTLGGILTEHFGWRSIFVFCTLLGLVILFTVLKFMKTEWTEAKGEKYDIGGTLIYCISLILLLCGFTFLQRANGLILLIAGIVGVVLFAVWASKTESPVVNLSLFKGNRIFIFSIIAALINYGIIFVISYILSLYLQYISGLSPQYAGMVLITQPLLQAVFSPIAGKLSDRMESRIVACIGMTLNCIGLILLIFIGGHTPLIYIIIGLALEGLGCAFFISPNQNTVMNSVEKQSYGVASGILATMRNIGQMICMAIATMCLTAYIGNSQIVTTNFSNFLKSVHLTLVIMTALGIFGILCVLIKVEKKQNNNSEHII
jgi:Major Facilitator Superfamily.